jgi:hypothetical protein
MSNNRRRPTANEMIVLLAEVDRVCPLCSKPLQKRKNGKLRNRVEIAHVYPLNPTAEEEKLLANEIRLSADVNAIENLLALCEGCHTEFDKPRTVEEYRKVVHIKKTALARSASREKWWEFKLQHELREIVEALMTATPSVGTGSNDPLSYDPKTLDEKVGDELNALIKNRVRYEITAYYQSVKNAFRALEKANASSAQQVLLQVKAYYLEQTKLELSHADILRAIADWVESKTGADTEISNILASFFVQNCEVF